MHVALPLGSGTTEPGMQTDRSGPVGAAGGDWRAMRSEVHGQEDQLGRHQGAAALSDEGRVAYEDEVRISAFRAMVYRLRVEAGLTQAELAERMGTTQSAITRMEGGAARPTLETLEKLAAPVGAELVVGVGENLSDNRSIAKLVREGHAVIRRAS